MKVYMRKSNGQARKAYSKVPNAGLVGSLETGGLKPLNMDYLYVSV